MRSVWGPLTQSQLRLLELNDSYCSSDADTEIDISGLFIRKPAERPRKRQHQPPADEIVEVEEPPAAAAAAAAPRPVRTKSATQREIDAWLWNYIEENSITDQYQWNRESKNALEAASLNRSRDGVALPLTKQLLARLRTLVEPSESE